MNPVQAGGIIKKEPGTQLLAPPEQLGNSNRNRGIISRRVFPGKAAAFQSFVKTLLAIPTDCWTFPRVDSGRLGRHVILSNHCFYLDI
jgi:hypothetical protein